MVTRVARRTLTAVVLACVSGLAAFAASSQVSSNGFVVKHKVVISAPPARVYRTLVKQVGKWWDPRHTHSGDSNNLSIDARPGGCFCETLPNGGGVEHLRVVYLQPDELIRMSGALGPLQSSGVLGSLSWKLTSAGDTTTLEVSYVVGGFMEGGFEHIAPLVD